MFELSRTSITDQRYQDGQNYQSVPTQVPTSDYNYPPPNWKKDDDVPSPSSPVPLQPTQAFFPPSVTSPQDSPTNKTFRYCTFCERQVLTTVELQPSIWCFVVVLLMFLTCGWVAFCVIPFIWPLLQTVVHQCPLCHDVLEKRSRVSCVRDEVITIRVGSCALVLSRSYVIICGIMLTLIMVVVSLRWYLNFYGFPDIPRGEPISSSWHDFQKDCGVRSFLGNPVRAGKRFEDAYLDKTVRWEGRMHHVQQGIFGKQFMYLDMDPRQYQRNDLRDVALIFGKTLLTKVTEVEVGDLLSIEATLLELGKRGRPNLGVLWDFNVTAKAANLPPLDEPRSRFVILREGIASPPIDLVNVMRNIKNVQQSIYDKQETLESRSILLPFGDVHPPIRVIRITHPQHQRADIEETRSRERKESIRENLDAVEHHGKNNVDVDDTIDDIHRRRNLGETFVDSLLYLVSNKKDSAKHSQDLKGYEDT